MPIVKTTAGKILNALKLFKDVKGHKKFAAFKLGVHPSTISRSIQVWEKKGLTLHWDGSEYVLKSCVKD